MATPTNPSTSPLSASNQAPDKFAMPPLLAMPRNGWQENDGFQIGAISDASGGGKVANPFRSNEVPDR